MNTVKAFFVLVLSVCVDTFHARLVHVTGDEAKGRQEWDSREARESRRRDKAPGRTPYRGEKKRRDKEKLQGKRERAGSVEATTETRHQSSRVCKSRSSVFDLIQYGRGGGGPAYQCSKCQKPSSTLSVPSPVSKGLTHRISVSCSRPWSAPSGIRFTRPASCRPLAFPRPCVPRWEEIFRCAKKRKRQHRTQCNVP